MADRHAIPVVTLLSDYGHGDEFVGVCHGVIAVICPDARIIDLAHGLPRHAVRPAALALRNALAFMPVGIHVAIVDPGVGSPRRALALRTADERILVGPDNGVLIPAARRAGGVVEAVDIGRSPWRLEPVSATFHGRDVFAPVAAHLARGEPLAGAGDPCDAGELADLGLPRPRRDGNALVTHALTIDRFGNVVLDASHHELEGTGLRLGQALELEVSGRLSQARYALTFADVAEGETLVYEDAQRTLAVAINRGDAARQLAIATDAELRLRPA